MYFEGNNIKKALVRVAVKWLKGYNIINNVYLIFAE